MIINEWEPYFTAKYGHDFPDTYLCVDTEYTGGDERSDFIMEIGHVMVENRRVTDRLNIVLDWSIHPGVDHELLRYKINNIRSIMGDDWRITWEVMKDEGISPFKALSFYKKFFKAWDKRGLPYVAHNGRVAEERMLRGAFNSYLNRSFVIGDNQLWDTGAIFKATQMLNSMDPKHNTHRWKCFPQRSDSMRDYFDRVLNARLRGIRWKLGLCLEHYDLTGKLTDDHRYHQAVHDAYCSHLLMEAFRSEVTRSNSDRENETVKDEQDILEQLEDNFPEIVDVPQQPLEAGAREIVPGTVETTLPPAPAFHPPSEPENKPKPKPKTATPSKVKELKPRAPATRGRKRGQRVV